MEHAWKLKPWEWHALPSALSSFKHLETLALEAGDDEASDGRPHSHAYKFVERCMASCGTLRCVYITAYFRTSWRSPNTTPPQHISFNRVPGTKSNVEIGGFEALVDSAWRDM